MTWKLLFARDSRLWNVLLVVGGMFVLLVMGIENPEDYGISPVTFRWLVRIAAVIAAVGGKFGLSPSQSTREIQMGGSGG